MSYILDALKKAEAESSPDMRAALAIEQDSRRRQRLLGYFVLAALLINAVLLSWLFYPEGGTEPAATRSSPPPAEPQSPGSRAEGIEAPVAAPIAAPAIAAPATAVVAPPADLTPAAVPRPAVTRQADPVPAERSSAEGLVIGPDFQPTAPADRPPAAPSRRVDIAQLPVEVLARLPDFDYSTHIFASSPDLRAVVINGRRLVEGDRINGVTLSEITEDGVLLAFEQYLIAVPVLIDWDE